MNNMKKELEELLEEENIQGIRIYFDQISYLRTGKQDVEKLVEMYKSKRVSVDNIIENAFLYKGENLHFIIYLLKKNNLN